MLILKFSLLFLSPVNVQAILWWLLGLDSFFGSDPNDEIPGKIELLPKEEFDEFGKSIVKIYIENYLGDDNWDPAWCTGFLLKGVFLYLVRYCIIFVSIFYKLETFLSLSVW